MSGLVDASLSLEEKRNPTTVLTKFCEFRLYTPREGKKNGDTILATCPCPDCLDILAVHICMSRRRIYAAMYT